MMLFFISSSIRAGKKTISLAGVALLLSIVAGCGLRNDPNAMAKLESLLKKKDYFKLEALVKQYSGSISDKDNLCYKSFIDNAFNRNTDCIKDAEQLLSNYRDKLSDTSKARLLQLESDSYFKTFQYAKTVETEHRLIDHYAAVLSKDQVDDIKNSLLMHEGLKATPPQQIIKNGNTAIQWTRDKIGLVEIPVKTKMTTFSAIFDTRANISSITQTYARKLGLHILNASYNEGSSATGIQFKTGLGVADSLYLGDILIKNVVFQVMPDSILYIAPIKYQLNIIIGFPVIEQLKEVHIFKDGRMTIPANPEKKDLHNFALDGLDPVIALKKGNDTLSFHFDSGASSSIFYQAYFDKYKTDIVKNGIQKVVGFGGAGGTQKKTVYVLPKLSLQLGNRSVNIESASILTKKIVPDEKFYGNIGQDLTNQFSEIIYNFKYMYVEGR